jgi:deoxyribose-phosphate aldolase
MQGLKQRILIATSEDEVQKLLNEGKTYEFASKKTRNSWVSAARRKAAGEKYVATKAEKPKSKKKARRTRI